MGHIHSFAILDQTWFDLGEPGKDTLVFWLVKTNKNKYKPRDRIRIEHVQCKKCNFKEQHLFKVHICKKACGFSSYKQYYDKEYWLQDTINSSQLQLMHHDTINSSQLQLMHHDKPYIGPYIRYNIRPDNDPD